MFEKLWKNSSKSLRSLTILWRACKTELHSQQRMTTTTNDINIDTTSWEDCGKKLTSDDLRGKFLVCEFLKLVYADDIAAGDMLAPVFDQRHHGNEDLRLLNLATNAKIARLSLNRNGRFWKKGFQFGRMLFEKEPLMIGVCIPDVTTSSSNEERAKKLAVLADAGFNELKGTETIREVLYRSRVIMCTAASARFADRLSEETAMLFPPKKQSESTTKHGR